MAAEPFTSAKSLYFSLFRTEMISQRTRTSATESGVFASLENCFKKRLIGGDFCASEAETALRVVN